MSIIIPGTEGKLKKTALIFAGIELVTIGFSFLLKVYLEANMVQVEHVLLLANLIVLPVFYGYGILSRLIK